MPQPAPFDIIVTNFMIGVIIGLLIDSAISITILVCHRRQDKLSKLINLTYFKICAWMFRKKLVMINNHDYSFLTLAESSSNRDDILFGYYDFKFEVMPLMFLPDGSVCYLPGRIHNHSLDWLPYDLEERTFMVLQGARNFTY